MTKIRGTITKVFCVKENWASFVVADEKNKKESYKCAGKAYNAKEGVAVEIEAEENVHPVYGLQYNITSYKTMVPKGTEGIQAYLSSGIIKGIGPETAKKIVNMFGKNTMKIIESNPEKLLQIPRMTEKKVNDLVKSYENYKSYEQIFSLANGVITLNEVEKILTQYKGQALEVLKNDPYRICLDIDGIGFLKADKIAKACGVKEMSECRMKAGISFTLEDIGTSKGHCYVGLEELEQAAIKILNRIPEDLIRLRGFETNVFKAYDDWESERQELFEKYRLEEKDRKRMDNWYQISLTLANKMADIILGLEKEGTIIIDGEKAPNGELDWSTVRIASSSLYKAEEKIAQVARTMMKRQPCFNDSAIVGDFIAKYTKDTGFMLAPEQRDAVIFSVTNRFSIITGGPGRGKTSIIKVIIAFWRNYVKDDIILLAPTGRAAQRIRESIGEAGVEAATIHKMTGMGIMSPMREASKKTLVICDESSMVDVKVGRYLMEFSEKATLILVGDVNQLPPVGPGNIFKDFINSSMVPVSKLVTCYRNAGLIAKNADLVNEGNVRLEPGPDFQINYMPRENMLDVMVSDYMNLIQKGVHAKDICVVTLQRVKGATNLNALNEAIQNTYNPMKKGKKCFKGGRNFRIGDRVIQMRNNYQMEYEYIQTRVKGTGVFNGDTGTITEIDEQDEMLQVTFDDGRRVLYGRIDAADLELAYAMTAHKVQGSEYEYILCSVCMDQYMLLSRAVVYTILSRAKKEVHGYFEQNAIRQAIRRVESSKRNTRLKDFLTETEEGDSSVNEEQSLVS